MKVTSVKEIGEALRAARKERKMHVANLAKRGGYSANTLYYWEKGARKFSVPALFDWAEVLGYEVHLVKKGSSPPSIRCPECEAANSARDAQFPRKAYPWDATP